MATIAEFDLTLSARDRRSAILRLYWRTYGKWLTAAGGLVVVLGLIDYLLDTSRSFGLWMAAVGVAYVVLCTLLIYFARGRETPLNSGTFHFVADDEKGLHLHSNQVDQTLAWSVYRKAALDGPYLFLFTSSTRAQVIPVATTPGVQPLLEWLRGRGLLTR